MISPPAAERGASGRPRRCNSCGGTVRVVEVNHWLHAVLTVLTLGLWGVSWLAWSIDVRRRPWVCGECGKRFAAQ
jgi:hypothetical protein